MKARATKILDRYIIVECTVPGHWSQVKSSWVAKEILNSLDDYTKTLEQKLRDIECGECGKNMLDCKCED